MKRKLQMLIAEDKLEISAQVLAILSPEFEVVGVVSNGRDLVQVALEVLPDVIVADTLMPHMGGLTAMSKFVLPELTFHSSSLVPHSPKRE